MRMRGSPFAAGNKKPRSRRLRGGLVSVEVPPAELVPNNDDHAGHRHGTDRHGNGSAAGHREGILKGGRAGVKRISGGATPPVDPGFGSVLRAPFTGLSAPAV